MKRILFFLAFFPLFCFGQAVNQQVKTPASGASAGNQFFQWYSGSYTGYLLLPYGTNATANRQTPLEGQVYVQWADSTVRVYHNGQWVAVGGHGSASAIYFSIAYFAGAGTSASPLTVINSDKWGGQALPSQTGNSGKVLGTDGTNVSWVDNGSGGGGTVTSITPGYGFTSNTPITTSGTMTIDTNKVATAQDEILSGMLTTVVTTTATTTSGTYRLNSTVYTLGGNTNTTIPSQDATLNRYTLIVATTSSMLSAVNGTLATDALIPDVPSNDLLVSIIYIPSVASGGSVTTTGGNGRGIQTLSFNAPSALFSVSGSPANKTNSNISLSLNTQSANKVFAGPSSGSAASPTFRALVAADLPSGTTPVGANPTATIGFTAVNGSATTFTRSDGAPKADSTAIRSVANSYSLAGMQTKLNNYVPTSTTVAGFALSSNVTLANISATDATLTFSGTYNGSTSRTIGLNLGNANTWSAKQTFSVAPNFTGSSTINYVWTATDNAGNGSWQAASGGFTNPMTTLGDIIYGGISGAATRLAGQTAANTYVLSQIGTGSVSAAPSWLQTASAAIPSTLVARDGNSNFFMNNAGAAGQSIVGINGTTTLTVASPRYIYVTGSTGQTIVLPVVSTLSLYFEYFIVNTSSGTVTVQSSGGNTLSTISTNSELEVQCISLTGTTATSWQYFLTGAALNYLPLSPLSNTIVSIGSTTLNFDASSNNNFEISGGIVNPAGGSGGGAIIMGKNASGNNYSNIFGYSAGYFGIGQYSNGMGYNLGDLTGYTNLPDHSQIIGANAGANGSYTDVVAISDSAKITASHQSIIGKPTSNEFHAYGSMMEHFHPVAVNATATLTTAQQIRGYITTTSASAETLTTTSATAWASAIQNGGAGTVCYLYIDNTAGANTVTLSLGSGITLLNSGSLTIPSGSNGVGKFEVVFTSTTAATIARVY